MLVVPDNVAGVVLESSPDGIAISDLDGRIMLVNQRMLELFGYERSELVGRSIDILVPTEARPQHLDDRLGYVGNRRVRPMGEVIDLCGQRRDGSRFPVEISLSPVETTIGELVISVVRDVGARFALQAELQQARLRSSLAEDRERIARDLHDHVIQRLFADGLSIQSILGRVDDDVRLRLQAVLDDHDDAIRQIRTTILALSGSRGGERSLRLAVFEIVDQTTEVLGFRPSVRMDGVLDDRFDDDVRSDVLAAVRESLSNAARHSRASSIRVELAAGPAELELSVRDDGIGIGTGSRRAGSGLAAITARATVRGGRCTAESADGGGTIIRWSVPID